MDYVVGSVAALISGNVTPSRPKLIRKALTPIKHQPSPNVTPKSEFVDDRSIFLSPTLQKKKAVAKKSPKRIFENPDLDVTSENENNSNPSSPKADKVKKHLNEQLEAGGSGNKSLNTTKSPKKKRNKSAEPSSPALTPEFESPQSANENTPKKQKKRKTSEAHEVSVEVPNVSVDKPTKKNKKQSESENSVQDNEGIKINDTPKKKKKKSKNLATTQETTREDENIEDTEVVTQSNEEINPKSPKKKNKKRKNKSKGKNQLEPKVADDDQDEVETEAPTEKSKKSKKKNKPANFVNPNAITEKDSDSEHESDDEIVSENEEANKEVLDTGPVEESSDEEEEPVQPKKGDNKEKVVEATSEDEVKRTLFVGNVPFSKKCKKEIKKIFNKYGDIETVRIRTVPVKDARVTPKLAVIKNELHPERTTVNVYIKFKEESSVEQALAENNTVFNNCHLRVSRSASTGAEHDPRCCVFVGNVPFALEDEALRDKFAKCGEIVSVRIVRDRKTNAGKGFAYVNFASKDGVELALTMSEEDLTIKNRIMRVKRSMQSTNKQKTQNSGPTKKFQGNFPGKSQGNFQGKGQGRNMQNRNQFGKKGGNFRPRQGQSEDSVGEGAARRIMHKRKNQDGGDGPPHKRQKNLNQPQKEKKARKEFVGMTAEKKKKHTFNKGQKKKKALSEILTKYS